LTAADSSHLERGGGKGNTNEKRKEGKKRKKKEKKGWPAEPARSPPPPQQTQKRKKKGERKPTSLHSFFYIYFLYERSASFKKTEVERKEKKKGERDCRVRLSRLASSSPYYYLSALRAL